MNTTHVTGSDRFKLVQRRSLAGPYTANVPRGIVHAVAPAGSGPGTAVCGEAVTVDADIPWLTAPGGGTCADCLREVPA